MRNAIELGEKTKLHLPLVWVVAIVGTLLMAGAAGGGVLQQGDRLAKVEAKVSAAELQNATRDADYRHILGSLERIERKLDRAERRRLSEDVP